MFKPSSMAEQVAAHLSDELQRGRWTGEMPGRDRLAAELGVNGRTVERALEQLERGGLLQSQGAGRRRRIVAAKKRARSTARVEMILYERDDAYNNYILELRRQLDASGHTLSFAPKTLVELKQDPVRVAQMVQAHPARARIVTAGARPVLEWFAQVPVPVFALFGRLTDLPIAGTGPDKAPALREALHQLMDRGHRKIVMLSRAERRKPDYGVFEQLFLDELKARGIRIGSYNLPDWDETAGGLNQCLHGLFQVTPPTALLVSDPLVCLAVKNYLASHRGLDLRKVVLICTDHHPSLDWCEPRIPHFRWDLQPIVRRVVRWADNVACGKDDRRQSFTAAKFIGGEVL